MTNKENTKTKEEQYLEDLDIAIQELGNEPGRNAKGDILVKYTELPYFKEVIHFMYNKFITTGISKKKINQDIGISLEGLVEVNTLLEMMNYVKDNNTGKLENVSVVNSYIKKYPKHEKLLQGIATKDIPLGVSESTINKVYGKTYVPTFDVMKAQKFDIDKHSNSEGKLKETYAITKKLDGTRAICLIDDNGNIDFKARSGRPHEGYTQLIEDIKQLGIRKVVLDGELLAKNVDNLPSDELFTLTQSVTRKKGEKEDVIFWVYDLIDYEGYVNGESKYIYKERRTQLDNNEKLKESKYVKPLPILEETDELYKVMEYSEWADKEQLEGVMLNSLESKYVTKRTKNILKVKTFHRVDLRCIGVDQDRHGNNLAGAIVVDYKGYKVGVGGLKDVYKEEFWKNPNKVIGKIVEIEYFEESKNRNGGISLRYPTFVQIREDKDEVSYD